MGVGKLLRIYDIGKKKLLRKCELKVQLPVCMRGGTEVCIVCLVLSVLSA